jgi:DNA-binding MarR family transcriptional regulator
VVSDTRHLNRQAVLTELLRSRPSSRKDIAAAAHLSRSTVSRVVDELIADGLVVEGEGIVV